MLKGIKPYIHNGQNYDPGSYGYEKKKKTLHKACWKIISEIVRKSAIINYGVVQCYTCGKKFHWKDTDCGHYVHAGTSSLSLLDLLFDNLRTQCKYCNKHLKGNLGVYGEKLKNEIGEDRFNNIIAVKHQINKMGHEEYIELKKSLKKRLDEINRRLYGKSSV